MPIFVYHCTKCDHVMEIITLKSGDAPKKAQCPNCDKPTMVKQPSLSNFVMK